MNRHKVAIYLRLSKDDNNYNKESNSITNQKRIIDEFISKNGDLELGDYYIDDGYSGTNFNRPDFKRMLKDLVNSKINTIIVKDLSRFGRSHIEVDNYLKNIFPIYETRFISINDDIDNYKNPESLDNISVPLKSLMNDYYAKDISNKVKSTLKVKRESGEFVGVSAPYGYIKDPYDKHKFTIDNEASYVVKKIFNMTLLGKSRKEIAEYLNKKEILTPGQYKIKNNIANYNLAHTMNCWNADIVNKVLRNESYTGILIQGKNRRVSYRVHKLLVVDSDKWIVTQNHHKAVINKNDFDKVQEILNNHLNRVNKKGKYDIFSGYIKCADCSKPMTIKKGKNKEYYYCSSYTKNKACSKHSISKNIIEDFVLHNLKKDKSIENLNRGNVYKYVKCIYIGEENKITIEYKD